MQVDKFFLSTLLSGYYLSTCIFHSNNSNWGHSTSMLHTSGSVASVIYSPRAFGARLNKSLSNLARLRCVTYTYYWVIPCQTNTSPPDFLQVLKEKLSHTQILSSPVKYILDLWSPKFTDIYIGQICSTSEAVTFTVFYRVDLVLILSQSAFGALSDDMQLKFGGVTLLL